MREKKPAWKIRHQSDKMKRAISKLWRYNYDLDQTFSLGAQADMFWFSKQIPFKSEKDKKERNGIHAKHNIFIIRFVFTKLTFILGETATIKNK